MVEHSEALAKFERMAKDRQPKATTGFCEAMDFTVVTWISRGGRAIVKCFMAHHQGMSLIAIAGHFIVNRTARRFHAEPVVRVPNSSCKSESLRASP